MFGKLSTGLLIPSIVLPNSTTLPLLGPDRIFECEPGTKCSEAEALASMDLSIPTPTATAAMGQAKGLYLLQRGFWILELSLGCIGVFLR